MNRFKILSYCFLGLVLTLTISCSNEVEENNPNNTITTQLQSELKLEQFTNKNISENTTVNWNSINVFKKDSL
jgi:ligand-binding sensor protein